MDFKDQIKQLAERVEKLKPQLLTEEATKNALIMPFIQALGYDVFNPIEVVPEFISDVGMKKGEKVDYAIMNEGNPVILIECKGINDGLVKHDSQLIRYFHSTTAKFAILTNGQIFKFFTDLDDTNKMDDKPFLEFDIATIKEQQISELRKFHKSYFDIDNILSTASELKYTNEIKAILNQESEEPSEAFIKFFTTQVYAGNSTAKVVEQFSSIVKKSVSQWISDMVSNRLKSALEKEAESDKKAAEETDESTDQPEAKSNIETTEEELEGYYIVKGILRQKVSSERIFHRDTQTYFGIILDDNNRKPICRLWLNGNKKYLELFDENKSGTKHEINSLDDIYKHADYLLKTAGYY